MSAPESIKTTLRDAIAEAEALSKEASELSELKDRSDRVAASLSGTLKSRDKEIKNTVSAKRHELSKEFDLKISKSKKKLNSERSARAKEKEKQIKGRISSDTSYLRQENERLKGDFSDLFKSNDIPGMCKSGIYYTLFMPKGFWEYLSAALIFVCVFVLLPFLSVLIFPDIGLLHFAALYLFLILIFGGAYIITANSTRHKSPEVFKEGRAYRNQIKENRRRMRNIAKSIRRDSDDSKYELSEFDERVLKADEELKALNEEKKSSLDRFDGVTAKELSEDISKKFQPDIDKLTESSKELSEKLSALKSSHDERTYRFKESFGPSLGEENLKLSKLQRLSYLLESGECESLEDAVKKL